MDFGGLEAKFETVYPHYETLREWKCQAFVKEGGKSLGIEIVTFEEWGSVAEEVLAEVGEALAKLVGKDVDGKIFGEDAGVANGTAPNGQSMADGMETKGYVESTVMETGPTSEAPKALRDFEGVM
jgi:hypothetical protein